MFTSPNLHIRRRFGLLAILVAGFALASAVATDKASAADGSSKATATAAAKAKGKSKAQKRRASRCKAPKVAVRRHGRVRCARRKPGRTPAPAPTPAPSAQTPSQPAQPAEQPAATQPPAEPAATPPAADPANPVPADANAAAPTEADAERILRSVDIIIYPDMGTSPVCVPTMHLLWVYSQGYVYKWTVEEYCDGSFGQAVFDGWYWAGYLGYPDGSWGWYY